MISERKLAANRRNALKSTGPRTEAGKRICSMNGLKHGLRATRFTVAEQFQPAFAALREALLRQWKPLGPEELALLEKILRYTWLLRLAQAIEHGALKLFMFHRGQSALLATMARYQHETSHALRKASRQLHQTQSIRLSQKRESEKIHDQIQFPAQVVCVSEAAEV
jgi:hypothetical protein